MIIKNILRHFFVSRFLLIKNPTKKSFFTRAQKTSLSPRACEPARAHYTRYQALWVLRDVIVTIRLSDWSICTT